jgi:hypothetical protein
MTLNWKKLSLIGVAIAALTACNKSAPLSPSELGSSGASELTSNRDGTLGLLAAPGLAGNGAPRGKHVYSWNLIGTPHDYQGGCGDGRRIFVERDIKGAQILVKDENDGWSIEDCNATGGHQAVLHSDDLGHFTVYARILGKPGGNLHVCVDLVTDTDGVLCSIGTIDITRAGGQSKFKIQPDELFDAELEDLLWTVDTNKDFRIVQFRVYQE